MNDKKANIVLFLDRRPRRNRIVVENPPRLRTIQHARPDLTVMLSDRQDVSQLSDPGSCAER